MTKFLTIKQRCWHVRGNLNLTTLKAWRAPQSCLPFSFPQGQSQLSRPLCCLRAVAAQPGSSSLSFALPHHGPTHSTMVQPGLGLVPSPGRCALLGLGLLLAGLLLVEWWDGTGCPLLWSCYISFGSLLWREQLPLVPWHLPVPSIYLPSL